MSETGVKYGMIMGEDIDVKATCKQIGGNHYKEMPIQPIEFIHKNNLSFIQGNVVKYICRYKDKNGVQDLEKAKHYIELLIEMETEKNRHEKQHI